MRKICVVITARASYARIKTAMEQLRDREDVELQVVLSASALLERYGRVTDLIRADGFDVDVEIYSVLEGAELSTSVKSVAVMMMEMATEFARLKPDAVITVADRYETIATAVAASYMNVPLIHVQGGEFTGSIDNKVRHAITKLADVHLVSTNLAQERVMVMGEDPEKVIVTGCPSIDIAAAVAASDTRVDVFGDYGGVGPLFDLSAGYLVVMQHPVTTHFERALQQVNQTIEAIREIGLPALWFWPNVDAGSDGTSKGLRLFRERHPGAPVHFFKNIPPEDFLRLLIDSRCLVGNSSVGLRECSYLGVPVVNIGDRQVGRERATNVIDVDYDAAAIAAAIRTQLSNGPYSPSMLYGDGAAGPRIAEVAVTIPLSIEKGDFINIPSVLGA
jgi:UDP-hydrolysing UDP-N-acetyl-D-glucosamine 2-epimerase